MVTTTWAVGSRRLLELLDDDPAECRRLAEVDFPIAMVGLATMRMFTHGFDRHPVCRVKSGTLDEEASMPKVSARRALPHKASP